MHLNTTPAELACYDASGTRRRHLAVVRALLQVQGSGPAARHAMVRAMVEAAQTKDAPADLINVAVEELVRQRFELPAFDTFNRAAHRIRTIVQRGFYRQVAARLDAPTLTAIEQMFVVNPDTQRSAWERVRQDAGSATLTHLREHIEHLLWLETQPGTASLLAGIPDIKVKHFAAEAKTLDAARMRELEPLKQATLAIALVMVQLVKLHWVPDGWWRLLTDVRPIPTRPARVRRQAFEVASSRK